MNVSSWGLSECKKQIRKRRRFREDFVTPCTRSGWQRYICKVNVYLSILCDSLCSGGVAQIRTASASPIVESTGISLDGKSWIVHILGPLRFFRVKKAEIFHFKKPKYAIWYILGTILTTKLGSMGRPRASNHVRGFAEVLANIVTKPSVASYDLVARTGRHSIFSLLSMLAPKVN